MEYREQEIITPEIYLLSKGWVIRDNQWFDEVTGFPSGYDTDEAMLIQRIKDEKEANEIS